GILEDVAKVQVEKREEKPQDRNEKNPDQRNTCALHPLAPSLLRHEEVGIGLLISPLGQVIGGGTRSRLVAGGCSHLVCSLLEWCGGCGQDVGEQSAKRGLLSRLGTTGSRQPGRRWRRLRPDRYRSTARRGS